MIRPALHQQSAATKLILQICSNRYFHPPPLMNLIAGTNSELSIVPSYSTYTDFLLLAGISQDKKFYYHHARTYIYTSCTCIMYAHMYGLAALCSWSKLCDVGGLSAVCICAAHISSSSFPGDSLAIPKSFFSPN